MQPQATLAIEIEFTEELLGTAPANPELYAEWVGSKAPTPELAEEEQGTLGDNSETAVEAAPPERHGTVFHRDEKGRPFIYDYQVKGFLKDACGALRRVAGTASAHKDVKAYKKIIDKLIFVHPRRIYLDLPNSAVKDGKAVLDVCERPLRASTPKGERVTLVCSEAAPVGTTISFEIGLLDANHADVVEEWLAYGELSGIGQWANSGKGRFMYKATLLDAKPSGKRGTK